MRKIVNIIWTEKRGYVKMEMLSMLVSVVSIILGIFAIVQAVHYNKESEKINADIRKILNLQLNEIQTIERKIARNLLKLDENVIWMAKDSGSIYKLNSYDKNNNNSILTIFKKLRVKGSVLYRFGEFLKGDKDKFYFDFFYMAESKDKENIEIIKEELGNYGLLLLIDYQARRNS